jgi:hypothetical protein
MYIYSYKYKYIIYFIYVFYIHNVYYVYVTYIYTHTYVYVCIYIYEAQQHVRAVCGMWMLCRVLDSLGFSIQKKMIEKEKGTCTDPTSIQPLGLTLAIRSNLNSDLT